MMSPGLPAPLGARRQLAGLKRRRWPQPPNAARDPTGQRRSHPRPRGPAPAPAAATAASAASATVSGRPGPAPAARAWAQRLRAVGTMGWAEGSSPPRTPKSQSRRQREPRALSSPEGPVGSGKRRPLRGEAATRTEAAGLRVVACRHPPGPAGDPRRRSDSRAEPQ